MKTPALLLAALAVLVGCTPAAQPAATSPSPRPGEASTAPAPGAPAPGTPAPGAPAPGTQQPGNGQGGPGGPGGQGGGPGGAQPPAPRPYRAVITERAVTQTGLFKVHRIGEQLFFEIPAAALNKEMLLISRPVESTLQNPAGFFGGGMQQIVQWERMGNRIVLRAKEHDLMADSTSAIWRVVSGFRKGPVLSAFNVAAYGADSAAVVDVTELFLSNIPEFAPLAGIQRNKSWVERTWAFPENVNIEVTQTGLAPAAPTGPGAFGGAAAGQPRSQTARVQFSMLKLPDQPMMPRWEDERVGFISSSWYDMSRPVQKAESKRFIARFKLVKKDPTAEVSDPVEPIIYWIDPATPDWLKPWIVSGVNAWQEAFRKAGFSNAIFGRVAPTPEQDPNFSLYDARNSVIYWRPSTVANATGGQIIDPRSGQILKGEVNMYHNIMELQKSWYFIQVSPLDARARHLPLPDSLMGRLVEYVVTHEVGHSIGFPHNMKSSAQYPVDSIRSRAFLERMHGHVATLMDYSRFNYVAQPEDSIPPALLIPQVGPYDEFALHWGYAPIPGARTPDDEKATLDRWAREQDRFPWLRFSTPDAQGDPEDQTEAVGDADAVKATTLGMRNLQRVTATLIPVAEKPGENYDELRTLYDEAVSQWGRYMGHVASIVGGAYTQERYGTGARFRPLERARQQEAVRYLSATAFQVPPMFLDSAILRRIENAGVVERFRARQTAVVNSLLGQARLNRLIEFEALAASPRDAYTLADLMGDLRAGIFGELSQPSVRVNVYRRNLQRAFLAAADARLNPPATAGAPVGFGAPAPANPATSDVRAAMRAALQDLDSLAAQAIPKAGDAMTRIHLRDLRTEIARILDTNE